MSGPPPIRVQNAQRKLRIDLARLQAFATEALEHCLKLPDAAVEGIRNFPELSVVLVSDRRMAILHKKFMNIEGATDVLTFQHGEIVVGVETAGENAQRFDSSVETEIKLYLIHGLLHLLGFDDKTPAQARAMKLAQTQILRTARA